MHTYDVTIAYSRTELREGETPRELTKTVRAKSPSDAEVKALRDFAGYAYAKCMAVEG